MKYQNKKTGVVIDVDSEISGEDWQALEPADKPARNRSTTRKKKEELNDE